MSANRAPLFACDHAKAGILLLAYLQHLENEPGKLGSLIGQSFLRRLHSVEQRGDQMVLRP